MPLVRRVVERRLGPDPLRVVGEAPDQTADRPCRVHRREGSLDVLARDLLVEKPVAPEVIGLAVVRSGRCAEFREEHVASAELPRHGSEKAKERRVRRTGRPRAVHRVAMHTQDVADARRFSRPDAAILLEIFHVKPERQMAARVAASDCLGHPLEPADAELPRRRNAAVGVLVPEIPSPKRWMSSERPSALACQKRLRPTDLVVRVPVARHARVHATIRDSTKARAPWPAERPFGNEVGAAHMSAKERGQDLKPVRGRKIGDGQQVRERVLRDPLRVGLEVFPQQKQSNEVATRRAHPREVARGLVPVELLPPAHRARRGPVVDADAEALAQATCTPESTCS